MQVDRVMPAFVIMPAIVFVCTGNVARSPLAAAMLRACLRARGIDGEWVVESAGTRAYVGQPCPSSVQHVAHEYGLDVSAHRARRVSNDLLAGFDLILTMERSHKESIQAEFPVAGQRTFLLSEMIGQTHDVPDPEDAPDEVRRAAQLIEAWVNQGCDRMITLARVNHAKRLANADGS
ncbi:MAG: low molecular weight protein arginine phosphatase [Anaerolineae bacterium]|nr:hypothetical protein [Thermoflexales bacterium]MDW8408247.1 low molecular weight protein arginine phosphatase [Anaerolineae bacterium]